MNDDQLRRALKGEADSFDLGRDIPPHVLRRAQWRRVFGMAIPAVTVVAVVIASGIVVNSSIFDRKSRLDKEPPAPLQSAPSSPQSQTFSPPVTQDGERLIMPVVFPDGSTTQLSYDPSLGLAELGVSGGSVVLDLSSDPRPEASCLSELHVSFGDPHGSFYTGDAPIVVYEGVSNEVEVWNGVSGSPYSLIFRFGSWVVSSHCDKVPDEDSPLIATLTGRETSEGFLLLEPKPPVRLVLPGEDEGGSSLTFGLMGKLLELVPGGCAISKESQHQDVEKFSGGAAWCLDDGLLQTTVLGPDAFVDRVRQHLLAESTVLEEDS